MLKKTVFFIAMLGCAASASAGPLLSKHVLVVEEDTGKVLYKKNADVTVPIASLTKVMTAMVVLDAGQDMDEPISIEAPELAARMRSRSRLPVGVMLPRRTVLHLALMSSDNRAAESLARAYPGGMDAFLAAVEAKQDVLGMADTRIVEPTGLSPANRSTPADLVKMAQAAAQYPEIVETSTDSGATVDVDGRSLEYRNTNRLIGKKGWEDAVLLSKTGTTNAAGRCLLMRMQAAGKTITLVLLNARAGAGRFIDAVSIRSFVAGETSLAKLDARNVRRTASHRYTKSQKRVRVTISNSARPRQS